MTLVYKIMTASEWALAKTTGVFSGSAVDRRDGFIHLSSAQQVEKTYSRHFLGNADPGGLVLVAVDSEKLSPLLRWEPSRGGELFPHFYDDLLLDAIVWANPLDPQRLAELRNLISE